MKGKHVLLIVLFLSATTVVAATYGFCQQSGQREMREMPGMMGGRMCGCMAGMGQPETPQMPLTQGRKEIGEAFLCPVDGKRKTVMKDSPATEYRGKTYYFCSQEEKQAFLQQPDRYVAGE